MTIIAKGLLFATACLLSATASADLVSVAVASNFSDTAHQLARSFSERTGHRVRISAGSSGKLYAQIVNGAPFDVFLSADAARPERLEAEQLAVAGSRFSYALGTLVLYSVRDDYRGGDCVGSLRSLQFDHLAIANPATAPYGAAARQYLQQLGIWDDARRQLVTGENISQAFHFTASQNAAMGLVAAAQLATGKAAAGTCHVVVPAAMHDPIEQQVVLLQRAAGNPAARQFVAHLASAEAAEIIAGSGYRLPE